MSACAKRHELLNVCGVISRRTNKLDTDLVFRVELAQLRSPWSRDLKRSPCGQCEPERAKAESKRGAVDKVLSRPCVSRSPI